MSGIPDSIGDNERQCSVIKIMKAIDIEVDVHNIEACHRIDQSKGNSLKKLAAVNTSAVGLGNSTRLFISDKLTGYNNKLAFECEKLKKAYLIHITFTTNCVVHKMKSHHGKSEKITHMSKLVELFPNFNFHEKE